MSPPGMLSAIGTRGSLTMPHSIASISEKSLIVHGKQGALGIARAAQKERRRREVVDGGDAELALDGLEPRNPHPRRFVVLFRFFLVFALELSSSSVLRLFAVAVMRFVIQHDDIFEAHQIAAGALKHLPLSFERIQLWPASLQ